MSPILLCVYIKVYGCNLYNKTSLTMLLTPVIWMKPASSAYHHLPVTSSFCLCGDSILMDARHNLRTIIFQMDPPTKIGRFF